MWLNRGRDARIGSDWHDSRQHTNACLCCTKDLWHGKMYTIPKSLRGTWYSKSRKVRITAHTYNGKTVYHQNTKAIPERIWNPSNKAQMREQNRLIHATRNKLAGYYTNRAGGKYFTVAPWIGFEEWDMFKAKTMKVNGKTVKYLDYSNGYTGTKFFKSRSLARKY